VATKLAVHLSASLSTAELLVHNDLLPGVLNNDAILDVLADNGLEDAVLGRELGDDGEWLRGVDFEASTVVVGRASVLVGVVSASVLVAQSSFAALIACAAKEAIRAAGVRRDLVGASVCLPDIHFVAANTLTLDVSLERVSMSTEREDSLYLLHR